MTRLLARILRGPAPLARLVAPVAIGACSACGAPGAMMAGALVSTGGEVGDLTLRPDGCKIREDIGAVDLLDSTQPSVVLRVVGPGSVPAKLVLANAAAGREVSLTQDATCTIHEGYHALIYGDRGIGLRVDCTTPAGGRIHGVVGAGVCR